MTVSNRLANHLSKFRILAFFLTHLTDVKQLFHQFVGTQPQEVGIGLGHPIDICKREFARNDCPPTVSAKSYLGQRFGHTIAPPVMV
jgi:hypothetical protein